MKHLLENKEEKSAYLVGEMVGIQSETDSFLDLFLNLTCPLEGAPRAR